MGYVNDTHMSQFIPATSFSFTAGTWTPTISSNVCSNVRTATAASNTVLIPILIPGNASSLKGSRLKSIDVWYTVATADLTDFATVELEKLTLPGDTVAPTGAAVATTMDSTHDTAAKRKAQQSGKMTITVTTPEWVYDTAAYMLELVLNCAATSVVTLFGALVHFDTKE
jgi:hypothetical protein